MTLQHHRHLYPHAAELKRGNYKVEKCFSRVAHNAKENGTKNYYLRQMAGNVEGVTEKGTDCL